MKPKSGQDAKRSIYVGKVLNLIYCKVLSNKTDHFGSTDCSEQKKRKFLPVLFRHKTGCLRHRDQELERKSIDKKTQKIMRLG